MNILDTIIANKRKEVAERKHNIPLAMLEAAPFFTRPVFSLRDALLSGNNSGIIAEFKRQSPSKGVINATADVKTVTQAYTNHGAAALSILTDHYFFGGHDRDIAAARDNAIPILRKDFIIDAYQIAEARAIGADAILLIAAVISPGAVSEFAAFARSLQLEVLLELHDETELGHICVDTTLVGINNRDLKTFRVDVMHSIGLGEQLPENCIKIAESGIHDVETISTFRNAGFKGFLMGEHFMKTGDPALAFQQFTKALKKQVR